MRGPYRDQANGNSGGRRRANGPNTMVRLGYARVMMLEYQVRSDLQIMALFTGIRCDGVRNLRWDEHRLTRISIDTSITACDVEAWCVE